MKNTKKFFKQAEVTFTESHRRTGGYFSYNDVRHTNALVVSYEGLQGITITTERDYTFYKRSKTLAFKGVEITERQYKNQLKKLAQKIATEKMLSEIKAKQEAETLELIRLGKIKRLEMMQAAEPNEVRQWILEGAQHPAPVAVLAAKIKSGLTWNDFKKSI